MIFEDESLAPYRGREPYIFISYSHRNADRAAEIIRQLNRSGFRVWYDEGLIPGREWDENIARIIMGCSFFISLLTKEYLASSNCKDELNFARDKGKPMLLIYLEEVSLPAGMELRLGRLFAVHRERCSSDEVFYSKVFSADGIARCNRSYSPSSAPEKKRASASAQAPVRSSVSRQTSHDIEAEPEPRSTALPVFGAILLLVLLAGAAIFLYHAYYAPSAVSANPPSFYPVLTPAPDASGEAVLDIEVTPTPDPTTILEPIATPEEDALHSDSAGQTGQDVGAEDPVAQMIEPDSGTNEDSVFIDPEADTNSDFTPEDMASVPEETELSE